MLARVWPAARGKEKKAEREIFFLALAEKVPLP